MDLRPMLATLADAPLSWRSLVYEPKYDGIRARVEIAPAGAGSKIPAHARIWSRNGNEKTTQFPAIVRALESAGASLRAPLVLDGEIVALDPQGRPAGFQRLQGRIHLICARDVKRVGSTQQVALIALETRRYGTDNVPHLPLP